MVVYGLGDAQSCGNWRRICRLEHARKPGRRSCKRPHDVLGRGWYFASGAAGARIRAAREGRMSASPPPARSA
eukprot:1119812-Pyramimonas_sp.AAC.1